MGEDTGVRELRVAVTVRDCEAARRLYRDVLGLAETESWDGPVGQCDRTRPGEADAVGPRQRADR